MKALVLLFTLISQAHAQLAYQGISPLIVENYNIALQNTITLNFKNTGSVPASLSSDITGTHATDFKVITNRCSNIAVNKTCQISLSSKSRTADIGVKNVTVAGVDLTVTFVKLDANGNPILPPVSESLEFDPSSLSDITFQTGEKTKNLSLSIKNTGSQAVIPSVAWLSNTANISTTINRCTTSLAPGKLCSITLKINAPAADITYTQSYQVSSSSQVRDSLNFVIKGPVTQLLSCSYNSLTYQHGQQIPGFSAPSVAFGSVCSSIQTFGSCNNGVVQNEPAFASCVVNPLVCLPTQHLSQDESQCINNFQVGYKLVNDFDLTSTVTQNECHGKIDRGGISPQSNLDLYIRFSNSDWDSGTPLDDSGFCSEYSGFLPMFGSLSFSKEKGSYINCSNGMMTVLVSKGNYSGNLNSFCANLDLFSPMNYSTNIQALENTIHRQSANPYNLKVAGDYLYYISSPNNKMNMPGTLERVSITYDDQPVSYSSLSGYVVKKFEVINDFVFFKGSLNNGADKLYRLNPATNDIVDISIIEPACSLDGFNSNEGKIQFALTCSGGRKLYNSDTSGTFVNPLGTTNEPFFSYSNDETLNNKIFHVNYPSIYILNLGTITNQNTNGESFFLSKFVFKQNNKVFVLGRNNGAGTPANTNVIKKFNEQTGLWTTVHAFSDSSDDFKLFQGNNISYIVTMGYDIPTGSRFFKTYVFNPNLESMTLVDDYLPSSPCNMTRDESFNFGFVNKLNDNLIAQQCAAQTPFTVSIGPNNSVGNKVTLSTSVKLYSRDYLDSNYAFTSVEGKGKRLANVVYKGKNYFRSRDASGKARISRIDASNNLETLPDICPSSDTYGIEKHEGYVFEETWDSGEFVIYKDNLFFGGNSCQGEVESNTLDLELFKYYE